MAEEQREEQAGLREQAKALREDMSPAKLNAKLEETIQERPKTAHLLDLRIVGRALLAAVVVAVILGLLVSWPVAAVALVVVFFGGWLLTAQLSYDRRRPTRDARADEDGDKEESGGSTGSGAEEDDSPSRQSEARSASADSDEYQADRGEAEAEQEQEGKDEKEQAAR